CSSNVKHETLKRETFWHGCPILAQQGWASPNTESKTRRARRPEAILRRKDDLGTPPSRHPHAQQAGRTLGHSVLVHQLCQRELLCLMRIEQIRERLGSSEELKLDIVRSVGLY